MTATMPEQALAVQDTGAAYTLATLPDPRALIETMEANLDGIQMQFTRISIPGAGGLAFELPGDDEQPVSVPTITGVILDHYPINAYWLNPYGGESNPPDCVALGGQAGRGSPGGLCQACPHNQWGSDQRPDGTASRGKACKNLHRVYILPEDQAFPLLLALPPTSLKGIGDYMRRLTAKLKPHYAVITRIGLVKDKNADGITYSRATFARAGDLTRDEIAAARAYGEQLKPYMRELGVTAGEYSVPAAVVDVADAAAADDGEPF